MTNPNPFNVLGLDASPDLTDTDVRDAWRAIAAATHPDRQDGGDPDAYAAASAAYAALRTPWARTEAYADILATVIPATPPPARVTPPLPVRRVLAAAAIAPARMRHGRPLRLAGRVLVALLLAVVVLHSGAGPGPIGGTLTGIVIWLVLSARGDLAPPPGR
jgi:hypothetical protein